MSDELHVEVQVRGRLGGDLLAMVCGMHAREVPAHTVVTAVRDGGHDLVGLLHALERAGVELERATSTELP